MNSSGTWLLERSRRLCYGQKKGGLAVCLLQVHSSPRRMDFSSTSHLLVANCDAEHLIVENIVQYVGEGVAMDSYLSILLSSSNTLLEQQRVTISLIGHCK